MGVALDFDPNSVDPNAFKAVPAGVYEAIVIETEQKKTKDNQGWYLELKLQIISGPHQGRTLKDRLNLNNKSEQAVAIARATLAQICKCIGVNGRLMDSQQIHNIPIMVKLGVDREGKYNEVKGYDPAQPQQQQQTQQPAQPQQPQQNGSGQSGGGMPWRRNS